MPYDEIPIENAAPVPIQSGEYTFRFSFDDGRATLDDLDLFSPENSTTNKQMLDFLDRVVTKVMLRGETLLTRVQVKDGEDVREETHEEGVRGKKLPVDCLKTLMEGVGEKFREANNPKN